MRLYSLPNKFIFAKLDIPGNLNQDESEFILEAFSSLQPGHYTITVEEGKKLGDWKDEL